MVLAVTNMAHPEPLSSQDPSSKRKRDLDDNGQQPHDRIPQPPPPQSGNGAHINYLARNPSKLQLIQGDAEVFTDVLALIGDYEGVLSRHESLAASLGARLAGPTMARVVSGFFEGPITVLHREHNASPVTWLDIVQFAKANPNEFTLTSTDHGRSCLFYLHGNRIEITEDDWRVIASGTIDRYVNLTPAQQRDEDENLEVATIEILEQRVQVLIKKADEVARKARQLNYHLSGRKAAINSRRTSAHSPPARHVGFTPHNHQQQTPSSRSNPAYDLKADLLQQFTAAAASSYQVRPESARIAQHSVSLPSTPVIQQGMSINATTKSSFQPTNHVDRTSPAAVTGHAPFPQTSEDPAAAHRMLVTARVEKLAKGDSIQPPCDRCRRLRVQCIKHLTACQGCTKKHAKCAWKSVTEEEIAWLKGEAAAASAEGEVEGDDGASRSGGGYTPDPQSAASSTSVADARPSTTSALFSTTTTTTTMTNHGGGGSGAAETVPNGVPTATMEVGAEARPHSGGSGPPSHSIDPRARERQGMDFGLREHAHRVDYGRLSQMASVALNSEGRDHQQQQSPAASAPRQLLHHQQPQHHHQPHHQHQHQHQHHQPGIMAKSGGTRGD